MIYLRYPNLTNCLLWAWWRFRVRPFLLIRKRGWKGWRARGGMICKRRGTHGFFCHRLWMSQGGHRFWGFTMGDEGFTNAGLATLHAFTFPGHIEEEREDPQKRRPHRIREYSQRIIPEIIATRRFHSLR